MAQATCSFGYVLETPADFSCPVHQHACTEIVFCDGSEGDLIQGDTRVTYRDGTIFVYQPGVEHYVENRVLGRHICFGVVGSGAENLRTGLWDGEKLRPLFELFATQFESSGSNRAQKLDLLAGFLTLEVSDLEANQSSVHHSYAQQARAIIERDLSLELNIAGLAAQIYISPRYLRQVFRKEFGVSPLHFLLEQRIERAAGLLGSTALPVAEVGREVGFANPHHFGRIFRRFKAVSPGQFRQTSRLQIGSG